MRFRKHTLVLLTVLAALPLYATQAAENQMRNGDFEQGIAGWHAYRAKSGTPSALTPSATAHTGKGALRVETPGEKTLEGAVTGVRGLKVGRRYRLTAWLKGAGTVMLAANSGGWTYGAKKALTGDWEQREISFYAKTAGASVDIITTGKHTEKVTFWIDDVEMTEMAPEKVLPTADVSPVYFEAEDYPANAKVVNDETAHGGEAAQGARWYVFMQNVPFPQTGKPGYIYVRARIESGQTKHPFCLRKGKATLQRVPLAEAGKWQWARFPKAIVSREIGKDFAITLTGPDKTIPARVDGCVVSTEGELTDAQLEEAATKGTEKAVVAVGKTASPPTLDGSLDDPCWKAAVEIAPFTVGRSQMLAKEQTRATMIRDDVNLYVAFRCEALVLAPRNNRLDAFKRQAKENDGSRIFKDDFVAVLLDTDGNPQTFFDLFVNANGAVNDARCEPPDHWGGRDVNWNSGAKSASQTEGGFWTIEMAIPFASIGGAPKANATWHVCLGRTNQAQSETSAWVPLATGFHNPDDFAAMRFADTVPGMRDLALGDFERGKNHASARVLAPTSKIDARLELTVAPEDKPVLHPRKDAAIEGDGKIDLAYELAADGEVEVRASLMNPATLEPWFRSPVYPRSVQSNVLEAKIQGNAVLTVNGKKAGAEAPLVKGENVIAIETTGPVSGTFQVKDFGFAIDDTWLVSESPAEGWREPGFDAKGWKPVGAGGWQGGKAYLRKRLLIGTSRFWPNWEPEGLWLAEDTVQQLFFIPEGVEGTRLSDFRLTVEVPAPLRILGASGFYNLGELNVTPKGKFKRNGRQWTRCEIAFPKTLAYRPGLALHQIVAIVIDVPRGTAATKPEGIRYYARAQSDNVAEVPRTLKVNILPPVNGKQPKRYIVQMWDGYLARMDDAELQRKVTEGMVRCGVNEMRLRPDGVPIRCFQLIDFKTWNLDMGPWLEKHPDDAMVDNNDKRAYDPKDRRRQFMCTTLLLGDTPAWQYVESEIARYVKERDPDHINWDYESSPMSSYLSCYCPRCLAAFRQAAGIPASEKLSGKIVRAKYGEAWSKFMLQRFADLAGKLNRAAKEVKPDVVFSVYSGYQSQHTREHYGVDWRLLTGKIDLAMCGYGRPTDQIKATLDALGDTPLVCGHIVRPYRISERTYPSYADQASLLRRCIDGTRGLLVFTLTELDGRSFYALGQTSRLVADNEDFFLKHQRNDALASVQGMPSESLVVFTDGPRRLVIQLNERTKPVKATLTHKDLPAGAVVYDYYGKKSLGAVETHEVSIPAKGAAVFVVRPK